MRFMNVMVAVGSDQVVVPVLVNFRPLASEDVLSVYVPGGVKTKWHIPSDAPDLAAPKKKARKST